MAMYLKYYGEFVSENNTRYRVEIHTTDSGAVAQEIRFPYDEPLTIEWDTTDKITPIQSSIATLQILSETDRKFVDMYRIEAGSVTLTIYRAGNLYWRGTLDTEVYEEPYSYLTDYVVTLTFSDFGILDRMTYSGEGCVTLQSIVEWCLTGSKVLDAGDIATRLVKHVSTTNPECGYTGAGVQDIFNLLVNTENFFDDEGEAMTAEDVLTAILQPLALQIKQKGGKVYIFDINALCGLSPVNVNWKKDDAVLSTDKVYNNVSINFSPMDDPEMVKGTVEKDESLTAGSGGALIYCNYHKDSWGTCDSGEGFRFHKGDGFESNIILGEGMNFFQVVPVFSGQEETGVFWGRRSGDRGRADSNVALAVVGNAPRGVFANNDESASCTSRMIFKLPRKLLNYTSIDRTKYSLRINLSLLFDVRYNPYEGAEEYNESGDWQNLQDWVNQAYVPFRLILYDANGSALYHFENKQMMLSNNYLNRSTYCKWVAGAGQWGDAFLAYYDWNDRKSASGCGGWQENKPIIGYYRDGLPSVWSKRNGGDYIDLPTVGGYLELQIGSGVHQFDYKREVKDIYSKIRWVMYKEPSITLCYKNGVEVEGNDIEDVAFLNTAAKEDLSIDTVLGTPPNRFGLPSAKGLFLSPSFYAVSTFRRAGVTDRIERLLIGTIYSQYASRKTVLSGTANLLPSFNVHGDTMTSGKFMLLGEVQDLRAEESEITMAEIAPDDYQGVEFAD